MKGCLLLILFLLPISTFAQFFKLDGKVGNKYSIVIELEKHEDGMYSGRYAYKSTLDRQGDKPCSWLDINPSYESPYSKWIIRDCNATPQEEWFNINFNGTTLTARMKNAKGKYYDIVATKVGASNATQPLDAYFRQHLGDNVCDFDMFNEPRIQTRLQNMMGVFNYIAMKDIYQTQGPIEYTKGMYWGSGFMAHQCCDPYVVWAYDSDNNSFYVWILKDDRQYWWSESGNVPFKFRELVGSTI